MKKVDLAERAERPYLSETSKKALADRLARLEGHVRSVRQMILDHRCADEVLLQVVAVRAALNQFAATLLDEELRACLNTCMEGEHDERLGKVTKVLSTLLKHS
ncbi:MAG: metal-sensitive transcriptional regulator [Acidobacteriota bacterium]